MTRYIRNGYSICRGLLNRYLPGLTGADAPVDLEGEKAQEVKSIINKDKVVVFSKTYCPYCKMAKDVLDSVNAKYVLIELNERDDGDAIQSILGAMTGERTVPRVFINGECVGGGSDVKALYQSGDLQKKLAAAPAS